MTLRIIARHPSPVTISMGRTRPARHGWETIETPVTIPGGSPDEFMPAPDPGGGPQPRWYGTQDQVYVRDGSLWAMLGHHGAGPGTFTGVESDWFLSFLGNTLQRQPGHADVIRALRFTPLVPTTFGPPPKFETVDRVREVAPGIISPRTRDRIAHAERERSAARLQSWLDANLVVSMGNVMVRRPPFVDVLSWSRRTDFVLDTAFRLTPHGRVPTTPWRARAVADASREPYETGAEEGIAAIEEWTAGLTPTEDDLVALANHMPLLIDADARNGDRRAAYRKAVHDPGFVRHILDGLRPWTLRGAIAGISREEAPEVISLCVSAMLGLRQAGVPLHPSWEGFIAQVEAEHMPRLVTIPSEDGAALDLTLR